MKSHCQRDSNSKPSSKSHQPDSDRLSSGAGRATLLLPPGSREDRSPVLSCLLSGPLPPLPSHAVGASLVAIQPATVELIMPYQWTTPSPQMPPRGAVEEHISWMPDPSAWKFQALFWWLGLHAYTFLPFNLINQIIRKLFMDRARTILITPQLITQLWCPALL